MEGQKKRTTNEKKKKEMGFRFEKLPMDNPFNQFVALRR